MTHNNLSGVVITLKLLFSLSVHFHVVSFFLNSRSSAARVSIKVLDKPYRNEPTSAMFVSISFFLRASSFDGSEGRDKRRIIHAPY